MAFAAGLAAAQAGDWPRAAALFAQACQAQPGHGASWINQAIALERSGNLQACDAALQSGLARHPQLPQLQLHAGQRALARDQLATAEQHLRACLTAQPQHRGARLNLAVCLLEQQQPEAALALLEALLLEEPGEPTARYNRALALKALGACSDALQQLDTLAAEHPHWPGLNTNRAALLFLLQRSGEAWPLYEARFRDTPQILQEPALPRLLPGAEPVPQLLLVAEQGLGDAMQFLRYGPLQRKRCHHLLLAVPNALLGLARASGLYNAVVSLEQLQDQACLAQLQRAGCHWLPLLSAAGEAGVSPDCPQLPAPLMADPARVAHWRQLLGPRQQPRIAVAWQGNPAAERGQQRGRSLPADALLRLLSHPHTEWMALQRGAGSELLDQLGLRPRCHPAQHHIDPVWNFREIAAILASCDLLVSTDSAITHLAGAHGLPAILLLKPVPDWRWGLSGEQCSWYPRHRLFRQHPKEPWDQTISRLLSSGWLHSPATTRR